MREMTTAASEIYLAKKTPQCFKIKNGIRESSEALSGN
jgi:hypothetical protein